MKEHYKAILYFVWTAISILMLIYSAMNEYYFYTLTSFILCVIFTYKGLNELDKL